MIRLSLAFLMISTAAVAQVEQDILRDLQQDFAVIDQPPVRGAVTSRAQNGALLRGLDKMSGEAVDIQVAVGDVVQYERMEIRLDACRVPAEGEKPDSYAFVEIKDSRENAARFSGWMIASSPALNALDHPRYDIWVTRCIISSDEESDGSVSQ